MDLKEISNDELILKTECEVRFERASTLKIIKLFQEIYDRKLYLKRGFPSFYEMATKHFGYCAASAMRRINAMRLVSELPQFEEKIQSGELSLSVAADVQSFLYQEAKLDRAYSKNAKIELVDSCLGKSRREAEFEFARRNPEREKRESSYAVSHDRLRVSFTISKELNDKLNHLKDLLSHVDPSMTTESLIERLAEIGLDKYDPIRKAERALARQKVTKKQNSEIRIAIGTEPEGGTNSKGETDPDGGMNSECGSESKGGPDFEGGVEYECKETEKDAGEEAGFTSAAEFAKATTGSPPLRKRSRYITSQEKHQVSHDGNGCSYVDVTTGRRCCSRKFLQLDHVVPFARGGENVASNLRWMCGAHNRYRNEVGV